MTENSLANLERYESQTYSQNGEDGVIARIFEIIGMTNKFFVEFGTGADGKERNTRLLQEQGWRGLLMDACAADNHPHVRKESITADNINDLFVKYDVPDVFDLLSIDIDGNDYWVWQAIDDRYRPRVLCMEYNASVPPNESKTIAYDPDFQWRGTDYFGASLLALAQLSKRKGYSLVFCERTGVNAFFIRDDCAPEIAKTLDTIYRPCNYRLPRTLTRWWPRKYQHPPDRNYKLIDVA